MSKVVIVDYGVGNLLSVARAFLHVGADASISGDYKEIAQADRVVLPGVGAFGDCMKALVGRGLDDAVRNFVAAGRPMLGICVGMQILMEASEEFGVHAGLGIIPGRVMAIPATNRESGARLKIPHIGWGSLEVPVEAASSDRWSGTMLEGCHAGANVYFVHSFTAHPDNPDHRVADCYYGGNRIAAVVGKENVTGAQFHPEKSGPVGLEMIRRFLAQ